MLHNRAHASLPSDAVSAPKRIAPQRRWADPDRSHARNATVATKTIHRGQTLTLNQPQSFADTLVIQGGLDGGKAGIGVIARHGVLTNFGALMVQAGAAGAKPGQEGQLLNNGVLTNSGVIALDGGACGGNAEPVRHPPDRQPVHRRVAYLEPTGVRDRARQRRRRHTDRPCRAETLTGGAGLDTLIGSAATGDSFRDTAAGLNGDTIVNFAGSDVIDVTDLAPGSGLTLSQAPGDDSGTLKLRESSNQQPSPWSAVSVKANSAPPATAMAAC
jgi:hypothetical protein